MIGEVAAVISALKALNDGINVIKQSAGNAGDLQAVIGRFAGASEKYRDVEKARTGRECSRSKWRQQQGIRGSRSRPGR